MIFVIVGAIIGVLIFIKEGQDTFDLVFFLIVNLIFGLLAWGLIGGIIGCYLPKNEVVESTNIYALEEKTHNLTNDTYRYILEDEKGKYVESKSIRKAYIKTIDDGTPRMESYTYEFKNNWYLLFANNKWRKDYNYVVFYVPDGYIINGFNVSYK